MIEPIVEQPNDTSATPISAEIAIPAAAPELLDGQWRPGSWRGFEMFTCTICQWDTLDGIEAARMHKAGCPRCAPPPPPARPATGLLVADKWGNIATQTQSEKA